MSPVREVPSGNPYFGLAEKDSLLLGNPIKLPSLLFVFCDIALATT